MDTSHKVCCGCLSGDRKMIVLQNEAKRQCFVQIINEIPIFLDSAPVTICWECDAAITRFLKFKQQVKTCFKTLTEYMKLNTDLSKLHHVSKLQPFNIFNLHFKPTIENQLEVPIETIKKENEEGDVKQEDNVPILSDNFDDDTVLIEHSNKKKKKKKIKEQEDNVSILADNFDDDTVLIEHSNKKKKKKKIKGRKKRRKKNHESETVKEVELTAEEFEEERNMLAEREEYAIAMFRCEKCIVSFPNGDDLNDHIRLKHEANKSKLLCKVCECSFATEMSYAYHMNKHLKRFQCTVCLDKFNSRRAATKHYEMTHCHGASEDYHVNGDSYENGDTESNTLFESVDISIKQETSVSFSCDFCEKTFRWKTSLRKHLETHRIETGQKRKPYCEPCRLSFTTTSNLQKHVKTSSKHQIQLKLWKLKDSSDASHSAAQIASVVNSAKRQFPCAQCGRSFQWRGNLSRHLRSHRARANGELVCEPCNRTFSSIATYKQHMKISKKHVSESDFKYVCSECGKRFANKTRLTDHVDWEHLKNFVHSCAPCQKVFKSHTSLYLHKQVVHKKDSAEHLCDHCGRHFPNRAKLGAHVVAVHSLAAPFACARCPARFSWRSCLSRHSRRAHAHSNVTVTLTECESGT